MNIEDKAFILSDFWIDYRNDAEWQDFMKYNDLGFPLSDAITNGFVLELGPAGEAIIEETYTRLCNRLGIDPSESFDEPSDFYERL